MKKTSAKKRNMILLVVLIAVLVAALLAAAALFFIPRGSDETGEPGEPQNDTNESPTTVIPSEDPNNIQVDVEGVVLEFDIPELDLRGYTMDHYEVEQWFLDRLNYHRDNYGLHSYEIYHPARAISIIHTLDMRENEFTGNESSDGLTHQERHEIWMGANRTRITSTLTATYHVPDGPLTQEVANDVVDHLFERDDRHSFIMNPSYYYIGIGFSIDAYGTGRLCLTFASPPDQRANWHAMTPEEREIYLEEYLKRVRTERGWTPPEDTD